MLVSAGKSFILLVIGAWIGVAWLAHPGTVNRYIVEHHTETVTKRVEVPVQPSACKAVVRLGKRLAANAIKVDVIASDQVDLISQARVATIEGSVNHLDSIETKMRHIENSDTGAVYNIAQLKQQLREAQKEC